jgi:hypothetical protein
VKSSSWFFLFHHPLTASGFAFRFIAGKLAQPKVFFAAIASAVADIFPKTPTAFHLFEN